MNHQTLIASTPATASQAERQTVVDVSDYSSLMLEVQLGRAGATELEIVPEFSTDGGNTYFRYTSRDIYAGEGTLGLYSDKLAVNGSINFSVPYDCSMASHMRFTFNFTGATSDRFAVAAGLA